MEVEKEVAVYKFQPFVFELIEPTGSQRKPRARSGHRIVCNEKYMYSIGGFNPCIPLEDPEMSKDEVWLQSRPLFKELWRFNLTTKKWKRMPGQKNLPIELASTAVLLHYNKLIIYGGTAVPFGESCSNRLYVCNLDDGSTTELLATGTLPDPQYGQALIRHEHYLYTVGGTTGFEYTCDIHRFNLRTGVWEPVYVCSGSDPMEPPGRYRHELAYDGKKIYILGGGTGSTSFGFSQIPAFDLEINRWTLLHSHSDRSWTPGPRRCHGAVQFTDEHTGHINVIIFGGYVGDCAYQDIWRLDLHTLQWTNIQHRPYPKPVYFHSVALTPLGKMYTFGGIVENSDDEPTRTNEVHAVWLKIPSLAEISWEAVNFYYDLRNKTRDQLLDMGIPIKYIKRLED